MMQAYSYFDTIRLGIEGFGPLPEPPAARSHTRAVGKRVSLDTSGFDLTLPAYVQPPHETQTAWMIGTFDPKDLGKIPALTLIETLADMSPDFSRALWDFLRMCNPGWTCKAYRPKTKAVDTKAQANLDDLIIGQINTQHKDFNLVIGRFFIGAFLRGAFFGEAVLSANGREFLALANPDPASARFEKYKDPRIGPTWRLFQWQGGEKVYLDLPTIVYLPIDPLPTSPYGRPLATPALFSTLFLLAMLHDIRRVVQQQGYPRIDIEIDLEALAETMPVDVADDHIAFEKWVQEVIDKVVEIYGKLEPDAAYVHTSAVKVNKPVGTVDSSSLGGVTQLIGILERMIIRALKTMPIILGHADRVSEANANRQWEIYAAGIKALQHGCEVLLQTLFEQALQAMGTPAQVEMRFSELRTAELLRDAQVEMLISKVAAYQYQQGWITQDEAALKATGKEKAAETEPLQMGGEDLEEGDGVGPIMGSQPDPGSTREMIEEIIHDIFEERGEEEDDPAGTNRYFRSNGAVTYR